MFGGEAFRFGAILGAGVESQGFTFSTIDAPPKSPVCAAAIVSARIERDVVKVEFHAGGGLRGVGVSAHHCARAYTFTICAIAVSQSRR